MNGTDDADPEFVTEVVRRSPILEALREEEYALRELDGRLSMSRSTIHRSLETLADLRLVDSVDGTYRLTNFGRTVAAETECFQSRMATARQLDEFLNVVDTTEVDVPLEHFADADVVTPGPRRAHQGVKRVLDLFEESNSVAILSSLLSSLYVDGAVEAMEHGTEIDVVFDTHVLEIIVTEFQDEADRAFETGNFSLHVADDVPFELFIYDETLGIAAHDGSGLPRMYVESSDPGAIEWAEDLFATYRRAGRTIDVDQLA